MDMPENTEKPKMDNPFKLAEKSFRTPREIYEYLRSLND